MKTCQLCGQPKADEDFTKKNGETSRACADCRKFRQHQRIKNYYRGLDPDKRNTLTMRKRARAYGVASEEYSRSEILVRWKHTCAYCDQPAEHLDHVIPLSRGGEDVEHNLLPACAACNLGKGTKLLAEWAMTFGDAPPF